MICLFVSVSDNARLLKVYFVRIFDDDEAMHLSIVFTTPELLTPSLFLRLQMNTRHTNVKVFNNI